ncbi:transcriptional regulator NRG1 KNAG_0H01180 [Huiozyma naganishii CBS 8797]|uniref:C2H2-type domain-containing protein n=1 Tax=Huiozyma naganishii (strain ATCC MYA-139 / BCRC 22969 / CBS 8797 / KCTC 17520 / NBRC 10181 / NCYC 3082 / Yp74L-3) TaxID=1071383 RepID=J7S9J6_HUIN7|nr:hypothetical protein KNAG_0H01180 [Kazachstania naganishii CBS 8797]CCK71531.1 hypothetical protein KNAG_0H01180 [Kazachstania naganishii CBS 8797]
MLGPITVPPLSSYSGIRPMQQLSPNSRFTAPAITNDSLEENISAKYATLLPSLHHSTASLEDDLKCKLNTTALKFLISKPEGEVYDSSYSSAYNSESSDSISLPGGSSTSSTPLQQTNTTNTYSLYPFPAPNVERTPRTLSYNSPNRIEKLDTSQVTFLSLKGSKPLARNSREDLSATLEQRRKYLCTTCTKGFTTSGHLARHKRIHTGEKNHLCPFEGCKQRFSRQDNCLQHYRTHFKNFTFTNLANKKGTCI